MRFVCVASLFLLTSLVGVAPAQQRTFEPLWERYSKGEDVSAELRSLAGDEQARSKDRFNAAYLMAVLCIAARGLEPALEYLETAESVRAGTPQVLVRRAEVRMLQEDFKAARKDLAKASRILGRKKSPLQMRHQLVLARLEGKTGNAKKGAAKLLKLAKKHKKESEIHFFLGHLFETMDKPKDALEHYEKAIKFLPERDPVVAVYAYQRWAAIAVSSEGGSYGNRKLLEKAVSYYEAFLKRAPANGVPEELTKNVRDTMSTLRFFLKRR